MTARSRHTLSLALFTLVCYVLVFTSKHAPWHDYASLLFIWALVGQAGTFCLLMENAGQAQPQLEPVPIEKPRQAKR